LWIAAILAASTGSCFGFFFGSIFASIVRDGFGVLFGCAFGSIVGCALGAIAPFAFGAAFTGGAVFTLAFGAVFDLLRGRAAGVDVFFAVAFTIASRLAARPTVRPARVAGVATLIVDCLLTMGFSLTFCRDNIQAIRRLCNRELRVRKSGEQQM
jgi:hypothetical protein